jgi:tripartite-type tricarboxylate transporter receptor subunit TctC
MSRILTAVVGGVCCIGLFTQATCAAQAAETWPTRPIRLVVPFSPGGSTDITARVLAEALRPVLGQTALVDNRPGAAGNIATELVARAAPDGYTYLVSGATMAANVSLYKNLRYDFVRDFAHVSQTFSSSAVLVVSPSMPVANLAEFIAYVKSGQNTVNYGTAGHGSSQHLAAALFNHMVSGNMVHVAYKGGAPAATALLASEINTIFAPLIEVLPHIRAGSIKALAVCGKKRSALLPNVPPINDLLPGYESSSWGGMSAPAKTPDAIVNKLSAALAKVLTQPNVKAHMAEADKEPIGSSPAEFRKFIAVEIERLRMQVKISGAKVD